MDNSINNFANTNVNTQFVQQLATKQDKGDYLQFVDGVAHLTQNVVVTGATFNGCTSTEMSYLEGAKTYIQDQLDGKQHTGDIPPKQK